jgi:hypothetical protein
MLLDLLRAACHKIGTQRQLPYLAGLFGPDFKERLP